MITCPVKCENTTYTFLNFDITTVGVWERISDFTQHFMIDVIAHPSILGFKVTHVSKRGPKKQRLMIISSDSRVFFNHN